MRLALLLSLVLAGCTGGPVRDLAPADSPESPPFGLTEDSAIPVQNAYGMSEASSEEAYLSLLRGPEGQRVDFEHVGVCCAFSTSKGSRSGVVHLSMYELRYEGLGEPVRVYLNKHEPPYYESLHPPDGFTLLR